MMDYPWKRNKAGWFLRSLLSPEKARILREHPAASVPLRNRRRPPAAFCTHIATTMQWRITEDRARED